MHIYQYVCKTFLKELAISLKCRENFEKLLKRVMFLKILLFHRYNSAIFSEQSISTSHSVLFKFRRVFNSYDK